MFPGLILKVNYSSDFEFLERFWLDLASKKITLEFSRRVLS